MLVMKTKGVYLTEGKQRLIFKSILSNARTLTAEGIHQVHFSSEGRSLTLAGNRRTLINFKNIKFLSKGKIYSHHNKILILNS